MLFGIVGLGSGFCSLRLFVGLLPFFLRGCRRLRLLRLCIFLRLGVLLVLGLFLVLLGLRGVGGLGMRRFLCLAIFF